MQLKWNNNNSTYMYYNNRHCEFKLSITEKLKLIVG